MQDSPRDDEKRKEQILRETTIDPLDRRSLLSLEYLVSTMFIFNATEPRDAVYALLAIARDAAPFAMSTVQDDDPTVLTMTVMDRFPRRRSRLLSIIADHMTMSAETLSNSAFVARQN